MSEIKELGLGLSINVDTTPADLMPWDAQTKVLSNTGIERDGGVTNLYTKSESTSYFDKTFFTRNNKRVHLKADLVNNAYIVYIGNIIVGQIPLWAVEKRAIIASDATDVMATMDGTFLVLKITSSLATIQEIGENFTVLHTRSFAVPATITDGFLVRNKAPTWANVTSIAGVYANGVKLNFNVITDAGIVYTITNQTGFVNSAQVFAYYERGWIVSSNDKTDGRTFLLLSTGAQQGTYTESVFNVANYNQVGNTVTFQGYRDVITLGTPGTYGNKFTPPAALGGNWTILALTNGLANPVAQVYTFGGYELAYGTATKRLYFANNTAVAPRDWLIGHSTPSEIYGYLDNGADIAFKVHTILGDGAYISASFNPDGIGTPITEIGEMNGAYLPHILKTTAGEYVVIYRRGDNSYAFVRLSTDNAVPRMQEIASGVVKINTTSALCIVNTLTNDLQFSGNAYNGFAVIGFDAVAPLVQKAFVARYRGPYGGSVDTNYKSTSTVLVGTANLLVIPEGVSFSPNNESIDVYYGPPPSSLAYYRSVKDGLSLTVNSALTGTIYVDDQIIPPPIGANYYEQTLTLMGSTAIREPNYDGYQLLNETPGLYQSFNLFGNLYLFDGDWIYLATLSANVLQGLKKIANGLGLVYLASSPTSIYFLSGFDNSVYTFDGGQSVVKQQRFNQKGTIRGAGYSPFENTLALYLDDSIIWNRDGVMTESFLPISWPYEAFQTSDGIWIAKDQFSVKYQYIKISGTVAPIVVIDLYLDGGDWSTVYPDTHDGGDWSTVYTDIIDATAWGSQTGGVIDPLVWKSHFLGFNDKSKQQIDRYTFRVYKEDRAQTTLDIEYQAYYETGNVSQTISLPVGDALNPYDDNGYAYVEFIPCNKNGIAGSIQISCADKIVLICAFAEVTNTAAVVAKNRG